MTSKPFHFQDKKIHEYGSAQFYSELFSDILADVGSGNPEVDAKTAQNILAGFRMAIESWADYHKTSSISYENMLTRFIY